MRKALLALLTFVPLALGSQPALAARPTWAGGCQYEAGFVSVAMVLYEPGNPTRVVGGTVFCYVYPYANGVRGARVANAGFSGDGAIVGAKVHALDLTGRDFLVCHVTYYDSGEVDPEHCDGGSFSYSVLGDVFDATQIPDPVLCPVLGAQAPGVPGVVDVTPAGDVAVAGEPLWDCPPYDY